MKLNTTKFDQIQFVSSRKNYNVKESIEKLLGSLIKGDFTDELASDVSYMHLRRTTVNAREDIQAREGSDSTIVPVIKKSIEENEV